jgi:hypothetical protein
MSKHTPGPWVARRNVAFWEINPVNILDKGPYTVGDVCASDPERPDGGLQEANAKLIAAAPDLLDALQRIAVRLREMDDATDLDLRVVEDAIQKATGEAA